MSEEPEVKTFWVTSMFGYNTKEAIVVVTVPDGASTQMRPDEARDLALNLLHCAEAAEADAFLWHFLSEKMPELPDAAKAGLMGDYRKYREAHALVHDPQPVPPARPRMRLVSATGSHAEGIRCLRCGRTSYNQNDVLQNYCGNCHLFGDRE